MKFIVKLFPEITIKSKPVRQRLVKQLRQNVQVVLSKETDGAKVQGFWDKIEVRLLPDYAADEPKLIAALQRIPGIANILKVESHELEGIDDRFEDIADICIKTYGDQVSGKSFVVRVKRAGQHSFASTDLERYLGGAFLQNTKASRVELREPDVAIKLEIRDQTLYAIAERYEGLGGFPIGTQEPVLSLISGGFDSTVSSYLTMKRGLKTHFCFFNLGGDAHEIGVKQVSLYLWEKYGRSHRVQFVTVPFEGVVAEILKNVNHSHMGVILKRMMMRAAQEVADQLNIQALVTGESVSQVSSQTITNLNVIDKVCETLVLRPLITMDKQDIIRLSTDIGTEEFAKNMPEYCGVISDRPTTCAKLDRVLEEESKFDFDVLKQAVEDAYFMKIDQVMRQQKNIVDVEVTNLPHVGDVVIDIRGAEELIKAPLTLTNNEIVHIPFYELMSELERLDKSQRYLIYCEKGTMSQLHASHLKGMGYTVAVFKP
ncbi:tRNA 4-thiouridine(8) synthase ThiI [Oleiphilus sp. HI0133]|jgi:thiamine biosynthesis protein ThiI|nr:tRNA 4-thiouridine(8) synthase ThiI [Oleiphilus sp. HI0133]